MEKVNCNNCDASKYAGYISNMQEYCLLFNENLKSEDDLIIPCSKCNGEHFKEDTWGN